MQKRIEVSFYKNHFRTSSGRGTKPFQISCRRGKEYHFESHTKEKRSHKIIKNSKPQAKKGQSINSSRISNLVQKRKGILPQGLVQKKEVTRSPRTLGLIRKRIRVLTHENSKPCTKEKRNVFSNYLESRAEENSNYEVHQKILNLTWNEGRISGIIVVKNLE